jgi:hypothetical protein
MTEPKKKTESISEGTKTHLIDIFIKQKYGRTTDVNNRYTTKGTMVEEDSMTLYSRHIYKMYIKNEESLSNEFIKGTPDIITSLDVEDMEIIDLKSSWDAFTFFRVKYKGEINPLYYWQLQGYMALTNAKKSKLVYCLVNTPEALIEAEKRKLWYSMGQPNIEDSFYVKGCDEIDRNCKYDDIPNKERIHEIEIPRNDADIKRLYERIELSRKWIKENLEQVPEPIEIIGL